jgi:hypothetical protein
MKTKAEAGTTAKIRGAFQVARRAPVEMTAAVVGSGFCEDLFDAGDERGGVELGAQDVVGAVGKKGDAPVADEGYELAVVCSLDLGAEVLGFSDAFFAFNVDEDEVVRACGEKGHSVAEDAGGVYLIARDAENLVTQWAEHLALADVQDGLRIGWCGVGHKLGPLAIEDR